MTDKDKVEELDWLEKSRLLTKKQEKMVEDFIKNSKSGKTLNLNGHRFLPNELTKHDDYIQIHINYNLGVYGVSMLIDIDQKDVVKKVIEEYNLLVNERDC